MPFKRQCPLWMERECIIDALSDYGPGCKYYKDGVCIYDEKESWIVVDTMETQREAKDIKEALFE